MSELPELEGWEETRDSLHLYCQFLGAVRAALSEPHPLWWHAALGVGEAGPATGELELPGGGRFALTLDLTRQLLRLDAGGESRAVADLTAAPSGRALGDAALSALAKLGPPIELERRRWDDDGARAYEPRHAAAYRQALVATHRLFTAVRAGLGGERSPVQLWPHHFDLSFEWLSERRESYEEEGESKTSRAQIGFGFSPGDGHHAEAYYYATPWPFEPRLVAVELPDGGRWLTEPWQGALLPYAAVAGGDGTAVTRLCTGVYEAAAPALT